MSITTLRPTSTDKTNGTVTVVGAGGANGVTDDAPADDATYITAAAWGAGVWLGMADITLTADQRAKRCKVRIRAAHNSADVGHTDYVDVRLRSATTGKTTTAATLGTSSNSFLELATGWWDAAPGGAAWSDAVVDAIRTDIAWRARATGLTQLRVSEVYLDVDVRNRPVVSAVTVTGATSSTRPAYSFTFTDTDGDAQTRRQVKVFSAAQYGIAGFDPATSPSTWDSGKLIGDPTSGTVGVDLLNGATYKVYARAAKAWSGPLGTLWWSDWAASSAFTINLTPPPTPSLTATVDATLPGLRVLLAVVAALNLATDNQASLETDTAGWTALSNCSISRSTAFASSGTASLQMSSTAAGTMTAEWSTRPAVSPGATYTAVATVRSATVSRTVRVGIRWYDQGGALIGSTVFGTGVASATGSNTLATITAAAPANAFTASVVLEVQATAAGAELHRWDQIGLQVGSSTAWSFGGTETTAVVVLQRRLPVSSRRGEARNWANPQLVSGGGLTLGTDGFYARASSRLRSAPIDGPHPGGTAHGGARMIVWHPLVGAFNGLDVGLNNATTDDPNPPYLMPAVPGRAQTVSVYLKGSAAVNARVFAVPVDATNTQVGVGTEVSSATAALSTSAWTRYAATITAPAGTAYLRGFVELPSGNADVDVMLTGWQCELGSAATALAPGVGLSSADWETVRELDSTVPASPGQTYTAYDHEAPPGRPVLYRARLITTVGADQLTSAPSAPAAVLVDPPAQPLLKDPFQPENPMVLFRAPTPVSRPEDAVVLHPLGRDGDPVKITSWRAGEDGQLYIETDGAQEERRLRDLLASRNALLLQHHDGGQTYLLAGEPVVDELGPISNYFGITVPYLECARPE